MEWINGFVLKAVGLILVIIALVPATLGLLASSNIPLTIPDIISWVTSSVLLFFYDTIVGGPILGIGIHLLKTAEQYNT